MPALQPTPQHCPQHPTRPPSPPQPALQHPLPSPSVRFRPDRPGQPQLLRQLEERPRQPSFARNGYIRTTGNDQKLITGKGQT